MQAARYSCQLQTRCTAANCRSYTLLPQSRFWHPCKSNRVLRARASTDPSSAPGEPGDADKKEEPMAAPKLTFPPAETNNWSWQKAEAKASLKQLTTDRTAASCALNFIEGIHWISFPVGFFVAGYVLVHGNGLVKLLDGDYARLYLLVLGHLSQVFGGGITGNMMHMYEGWQVAPFRNPLALPQQLKGLDKRKKELLKQDPIDKAALQELLKDMSETTDQVYVENYNNAWLRSVAYQLLFMFQAFGISCNTMAIYGINWWTGALMAAGVFTGLIGPRSPRLALTFGQEEQPISPLPLGLLIAFGVIVFVNLPACVSFYGPAIVHAWPPTLPLWGAVAGGGVFGLVLGAIDEVESLKDRKIPKWTLGGAGFGLLAYLAANNLQLPDAVLNWLALLAPIGVGAGGAIEGVVAESTFDQQWHWRAFVVLLTGFGIYGVLYWHLIN